MKLYFDPVATTCRPVTFMAAYASIDLDLAVVSLLDGAQDLPAFRQVNPQGLVPVLVAPTITLTESTAILRYLASLYAPELYPADLVRRAAVDEMVGFSSTSLNVTVGIMTVYPSALGMPRGLSETTVAEMAAAAQPRLTNQLDTLNERLKTTHFVSGDDLTIADFHMLSTLTLADLIGFDYAPWPAVAAWIERMQALPGWGESFAGFNGLVAALRG